MIKTLHLKNFRRHENLSVDFTAGLNVIRGPNEAGKTTLTEAVLYALYGSKSLRDSLPDVVTWGKHEKELAVELELLVDGVAYTFKRSKAGAECTYLDKLVAGQSEVSDFATKILGADAKTASLLMMASQSDLRGALDEGPSAVSGLMGKLADFDLIDRIIENAQADLTLGSDTALRAKLSQAEQDLSALQTNPQVDPARINELVSTIEAARSAGAAVTDEIQSLLDPALARARAALEAGRAAEGAAAVARAAVVHFEQRIAEQRTRLDQAKAKAEDRPTAEEIETLRAAAEREADHAAVLAAYKSFLALPAYPEVFWEGSQDTFEAELDAATSKWNARTAKAKQVKLEADALAKTYITSTTCPTCGQSTVNHDHVEKHNAAVDAKMKALLEEGREISAQVDDALADLQDLQGLQRVARERAKAVAGVPAAFVTIDESQYPPVVAWKGEAPSASASQAVRKELNEQLARVKAADAALGQVQVYQENLAELEVKLAEACAAAGDAAAAVPDMAPLEQAAKEAEAACVSAINQQLSYRRVVAEGEPELNRLRAALAGHEQALKSTQARIDEYRQDLEGLAFNNGLVAKVRKLKPAITDHLWNTVLAAVSTFFSDLRGSQSMVTKDAKGFRVDGKAVTSYSGSTQDVLALAIRVALTKTFIPHCNFMTLDEPAHGCDTVRTGNVLAFLASTGFNQVVLASHDELSESVADNLIQIEA